MKLSEAILLGRHLVEKSYAGDWNTCAIGMAAKAHGNADPVFPTRIWPWLAGERPPCPLCGYIGNSWSCVSARTIDFTIGHIFDCHILRVGNGNQWTLEQLSDWVRSIEPRDEIELTETAQPENEAVTV